LRGLDPAAAAADELAAESALVDAVDLALEAAAANIPWLGGRPAPPIDCPFPPKDLKSDFG